MPYVLAVSTGQDGGPMIFLVANESHNRLLQLRPLLRCFQFLCEFVVNFRLEHTEGFARNVALA